MMDSQRLCEMNNLFGYLGLFCKAWQPSKALSAILVALLRIVTFVKPVHLSEHGTEEGVIDASAAHYPIFPKDDAKVLLFYDLCKFLLWYHSKN